MLHTKFQRNWFSDSGEEILLGFYHIWAWRPPWSCDLNRIYKLSFPFCLEAAYEISFKLAM